MGIDHQEQALIAIDKLDKIGTDGVWKELAEHFSKAQANKVATWLKAAAAQVPAELSWIRQLPEAKRLRFDPTLVRGMGYYTGAIFEIEHPESDSSIGGGGRYDSMVGTWSGTDIPAVGISLGMERILDLIAQDEGVEKSLVLLVAGDFAEAMVQQQALIAQGWQVRIDLVAKNQKAQLEELSQQGFTHFVQLGPAGLSAIRQLG
jgi:histidyl-tRNA synthetase